MSNCIVCSSEKIAELRSYKGKNIIFHNKVLKRCEDCEFVFTSPMPNYSDLQVYNSEYFEFAHGGHPKSPSAIAFFSGINKLRCEYVSQILEKRNFTATKILEIGPGQGYFAGHWLSKYPNASYYGVETDLTCHEVLNNIGVKLLLPEQVESSIREVDLVIMSHVLEHVPDPIGFLQLVTRKLKKGGALFIEVPCNDWQHKEFDEPHLLFFNKNSIMLALKNVGFDQIQVNYFGQTIEALQTGSKYRKLLSILRIKLIDIGLYILFACTSDKELSLLKPIERASTKYFLAHKESKQPAWWVRAVSFKL
jgi:SAM-dependent methyltransferase